MNQDCNRGADVSVRSPSEMFGMVLRTIGTKVRWLGPITGPNAFNCSTVHETDVVGSTSPSPATTSCDGSGWERGSRLLRSRIGHLLAEEHQPALRVT